MKLRVTVQGVAYDVEVEVLDAGEGFAPPSALPPVRPAAPSGPSAPAPAAGSGPTRPAGPAPSGSAEGGQIASPVGGTVVEIKCKAGDEVTQGQVILVLEAMKMNTSIAAPTAGRIKSVNVSVGDPVAQGQVLAELE